MKNKILPIIAGVLVIVAVLVVIFIPKNSKEDKSANAGNDSLQSTINTTTNPTKKSTSELATLDEEGNVIINKSDVSEDKILFLKYSEDSKIELIAIKGENGDVNVAIRNMWVM